MNARTLFIKGWMTCCLMLVMGVQAYAQSYQEKREQLLKRQETTRAEINVLEARIKNYQERVSQAEERFDRSFEQFQSLKNLIALQDDKIENLQKEQNQIDAEIKLTQQELDAREEELRQLIENYKRIILYAYKNGRSGNLEMLLTSESINQMLVRSNYLKRFEEQKTKQADLIRENRKELDQVKDDLELSYEKNRLVLDEIRQEKEELGEQRQQQEKTVEQIKQERSTWLAELRKTREQKENFESTLSNIIAQEESMRNERLERLEEARNFSGVDRRPEDNFVSEATFLNYEQAFAQAKGSMRWPVNSKTVAKKFGRVRNPLYNTVTEHPGIDIVADPGSPVRAVAPGQVFRIQPLPGYGDVVFVKHGSYYTAYGNLSSYDVEVGTILEEGDTLGMSGLRGSELGEVVFFLIRRGNENLNPENWLSR